MTLAPTASFAACPIVIDAPPEIAHDVQIWADAQARCEPGFTATARIEADGVHLEAHRSSHAWERTVDDARTAAALIASWAAPDEIVPEPRAATILDMPAVATVVGELAIQIAGTTNASDSSTGELGAGLASTLDIGRRWWRIGAAVVWVRDRTNAHSRTVPALRFAARQQLGRLTLQYRLGVAELDSREFYTESWSSAVELGVSARLAVTRHLAVRIDADVLAPMQRIDQSRMWVPVFGLGCEAAL